MEGELPGLWPGGLGGGGAGGAMHHPKSQKGPLLAKELVKNGVCVWGFKKSTFWVQKVHIFGIPHLPKIDPYYVPVSCDCYLTEQYVFVGYGVLTEYFSP